MTLLPILVVAAIAWKGVALASPQSLMDAAKQSSRANTLVETGKSEQAIPIYKELISAFPAELSFRLNLAIALFKANHYRDAINECKTVLSKRPDLFPAWLFTGASYLKLGEYSSAEGPLRKALALRADDPNARIMLADVSLAKERWAEAVSDYQLSAHAMPDSPRAWYGLGRSYESLAHESLKQINDEAPHSPEALALSAEFELEAAQVATAFKHFREALNMEPSFHGIHAQVADIYAATGHPEWAEIERHKEKGENHCVGSLECEFVAGQLEEVVAAKADSHEAIYWQANAFLDLSRKAYSRLQALPPSQEGFEAAALAEEKRGRYPEAAVKWKNALELARSDLQLQRRLALALCHANDCVSAIPLLKEQLVREPSSVELNYLCGLALNSARDPSGALPYLEKAVELDATFLPARAALGEAYLEAGKPDRAIPYLKGTLSDDESGGRHYQLARAYEAAGMHSRSVEVLREYRDTVRNRALTQPGELSISPP